MPLVVAPPHTPVPLPDWREKSVDDMRPGAGAFLDAIANRRTVRDFDTRPVPRDIIETCIRAAGTAPNGANHQPWHFVAISDPARKSRIRAAAEAEERTFHDGKGGEEWIRALAPLGADPSKPFLEEPHGSSPSSAPVAARRPKACGARTTTFRNPSRSRPGSSSSRRITRASSA
jgi:nitroreductase